MAAEVLCSRMLQKGALQSIPVNVPLLYKKNYGSYHLSSFYTPYWKWTLNFIARPDFNQRSPGRDFRHSFSTEDKLSYKNDLLGEQNEYNLLSYGNASLLSVEKKTPVWTNLLNKIFIVPATCW